MTRLPHIVILGGGPAGCGAAYQLRRTEKATVTLLERNSALGGNAGSFFWNGQWLDYGSHRLHHATEKGILADVRSILGDDLRDRERHGRIRLRGEWLHFPIQTLDLVRRLDKRFAIGMVRDMAARPLRKREEGTTFSSVLLAALGPTICENFYFPYARKLWGREPDELSGIQARKRVSAGSFTKLLKRLVKPPGDGRFYYPRRGYGQITEGYAQAARSLGAEIRLGEGATAVTLSPESGRMWTVTSNGASGEHLIHADFIFSTIPTTLLSRMTHPAPPPEVAAAAAEIEYRAMTLVYLALPIDRFSSTDAHYFPESNVRVSRLSEPKNYFGSDEPNGSTVLCGEYPCGIDDDIWVAGDEELKERMLEDMAIAGIPAPVPPAAVLVKRLRQAYPIYHQGYEKPFGVVDDWASRVPNLVVYGRQGLFAHDNAHHALYMAYSAADCLQGMTFDLECWARYREIFATHVIED